MYLDKLKKSKKIVKDMVINLAGTGISLVVLQLVVYPLVAKMVDSNTYGEMQSAISMVYLIGGTLGGALSTSRLLREYDYNEKNIVADFNFLNILNTIIICIIAPIVFAAYLNKTDMVYILMLTLITVLNCAVNYYSVGFRLKLDYNAILVQKIINCVGYLAGFGLFCLIRRWEIIFITSFLLDTLYCIFKTTLIHEPYGKSGLLYQTVKDYGSLVAARFTSSALTYFDKLILYPLLGGEAVSIYFAANVFGKLVLMAIEPITNVVLSYLSKVKTVTGKIWKVAVPIALITCVAMYFVCLAISGPVLRFLYPQWSEAAMKLIPISTLSLAVSAFINIIYPFTLKAMASYNQILINVTGLATYVISVLALYSGYGLMGCCIAMLISYVVKLISIVILTIWRHQ
ncbi:MAG: hypothetical protein PUB32_08485 [Clostridiales bacterium]|nr:hypothetical protein [Clostridiales bacterium]